MTDQLAATTFWLPAVWNCHSHEESLHHHALCHHNLSQLNFHSLPNWSHFDLTLKKEFVAENCLPSWLSTLSLLICLKTTDKLAHLRWDSWCTDVWGQLWARPSQIVRLCTWEPSVGPSLLAWSGLCGNMHLKIKCVYANGPANHSWILFIPDDNWIQK